MGRPRRKKGNTIKARMYKEDYDNLRRDFPEMDMSDLLHVAVKTSPLRLEAALRRRKK